MKTIFRIYSVALVLCLVLEMTSAQGNKRIGTAAGTQLLVPIGARDFAMSGSGIATSSGVESMFWNPAGLSRMDDNAQGMFSNMSYIGDIGLNFGAVAAKFGSFGTVGLSIKTFDFGAIPLTTNDDPENETGRTYSPNFSVFGVSYARSLTDAISVGANAKIISETIQDANSTGFAIDFGVQYSGLVDIKGLSLGVAMKNIGPQMKYDGSGLYRNAISSDGDRPEQKFKSEAATFELPSLIELGLSYSDALGENMNYTLNSSFTNNNLYLDEYRVGGEVGMNLGEFKGFVRGGLSIVTFGDAATREEFEPVFVVTENLNIFDSPTFGAGFVYETEAVDITVDYAYRKVQFFNANSVLSVKFGF